MTVSAEALAWRNGQGSGDLYAASDLRRPDKVKEVFAACKAAQGYITAEGWAFLFSIWQLEGLLELDLDTGWFYSGKTEERSAHLIYQSLMAGYNPLSGEKGDYESDSGLFLSLKGRKYKIDWDEIIAKGI
jgi:hypothetical protein